MIFLNHKEDLGGRVIVAEIKGALNSETSAGFEEYINQILEKGKLFIILNAESLEYVSSAGIGVILYIQKRIVAARGFFIVCSIPEEISALYGMLGFDKVIKITGSKDEAVMIMKKQLDLIEGEISKKPAVSKKSQQDIAAGDIKRERQSLDAGLNETVEEKAFGHPIILECPECKGMIRVKNSGRYICPDCKTEFSVGPDQTVVF